MKKALSLILMLAMVFSALVPSMALAADEIAASSHVNVAAGKSYTTTAILETDGVQNYPDEGGITLTDGVKAAADSSFWDAVWVGFNKQATDYDASEGGLGATAVIDLGETTDLSKVVFQAFSDASAGISVPYWVNLAVSDDGETFSYGGYLEISTDSAVSGVNTYEATLDKSARYVRVSFYGYGWMFIDEIEVYGDAGEASTEPETFKTEINVGDHAMLTDGATGFTGDWGEVSGNEVLLIQNLECTSKAMEVALVYDLGEVKNINSLALDFYHCAGVMVGYPEGQVLVEVSADGKTYESVGSFDIAAADVVIGGHNTVTTLCEFDAVEAAYVKATFVVGSSTGVLGENVSDGKIYWEFASLAEVAVGEAPADTTPELPEGAIALDYAGYVHDNYFEILAGDNMTVGELTALGIGAEKDMNYFVVAVVGADGVITEMHTALGRPDGVKTDVVCPEGGYIIGLNANKAGYDALLSANVGDSIELYNVDVESFRGKEGSIALENAGFAIVPAPEAPEVPENAELFWVTHYNDGAVEGAGSIFTSEDTAGGWWLHVAFAPVENGYQIVEISNGLSNGSGAKLAVPEGGFVWAANYGNNYPAIYPDDSTAIDYTSPNCTDAIDRAAQWTVGDIFEIGGLDFASVPTDTPDVAWYDDAYVCTAYIAKTGHEDLEPEPEPELPEGALEFQLSHVNLYSWGTFYDMVAYGEGRNCHNLGNGDYGCEWWIAVKVDNVDGVYTVTQIEGNGDAKEMTASADGFIMYLFSGNENYPTNFANAQLIEVGYTVDSHTFDWTTDAASETALGNIVFVPGEESDVEEPDVKEENVALGKPVSNADDRAPYNADLTDGLAVDYLTYGAEWFGYYWNPNATLEQNLANNTNALNGLANPIVDLGGLYDLTTVRVNLFTGNTSGICAPENVKLKVSVDGIHYQEIDVVSLTWPASGASTVEWVEFTLPEGTVAQYVCIEMTMRTTFVFLNEIEAYGTASDEIPAIEHNVVHVDAVAAGCHMNGNIEYWYCNDCGTVWQDEALTQITNHMNVIVPATGEGLLVHMEAVEPGCHYEGNVEYWICYMCEQVWTDEALTQLSNIKNVILPELGGEVVHVEAVGATCYENGNIEYWYCDECGQVWADEARTQLTNRMSVITPAAHDLVHVEAVAAGCHMNGNIEHWYCTECETVWADEALTQITNHMNVIVPATGEGLLVHMEAVEPACHYEGNVEYWICYMCEQVWTDEALTQLSNTKNVILPELGGDVVHVEAVEATCYENGNIEYWYCDECGQVWADEARTQLTNRMSVITPALEHNLVHMEAVDAGCHMNGNTEHWYCTECETVWADEALTQITNHMNVIIPAIGGEVVHMEAVEPGCHMNGNIEHWICYECEQVWQDEALTQLTNIKNVVLPATGSDLLVHMDAVEPGCHMNGNIEYWICYECEQVWADEALTQLTNIKNVILPATGEGDLVHMEAVDAGCHMDGNIEYWVCYDCGQVWQDEALTQLTNIKNVVIPAVGGEVVHVEAVEATCESNGNIEHWYCEDCGLVWQDEALTQITNHMNVIVPTSGHDLVHMEAVDAGCHYNGHIEHWYCNTCGTVWQDEALTQITNHMNVIIPATGSDLLVYMEAVEPGCHMDGNIEYWICYECEQVWQDEALTQLTNIKNVILPAVGGEVVHVEAVEATCETNGNIEHWYCEDCGLVWQDEALTQITNHMNVITPATGHDLVHMEAVDAGCHYNGHIEHWYCNTCETVWQDKELTQITNHLSVIIPATGEGDLVHMEAVEPGCHMNGNIEYWICYDCEQVWQDEALTQLTNIKNVVVPATGEGDLVHMEAVDAGCHMDGNIEYWICYDCEQVWQDEALTQLTNIKNVVVPAIGGEVVHVEAVDPACGVNGNIEHWYCEDCGLVWQDEALTQITNHMNVIMPALEHDFDAEGVCGNCGSETDLFVSVDVGEGAANIGDTVTVEILLDRNSGFAHLSLDVLFDTDVFELVSVENGAIMSNFVHGAHLVWTSAENATDSGVLVTLTLKVKAGATAGSTDITVVCNEAWNENELPATIALSGNKVEINDIMYGDANGDGVVNGKDATRLLQYLAFRNNATGESSVEIAPGADANGDGVVNGKDATRVLQYLAFRNNATGESSVVLGPKE